MDRGDILSGDAFAAVLRSAIAFIAVLVLLGWVTLIYVERSLIEELGNDVKARWNILAADHESEGLDHVVEAINDVTQRTTDAHHGAAIFGAQGALIAGNILSAPLASGLNVGPLDHVAALSRDAALDYIHFTGPVGDRTLTVGLRLDLLYRTQVLVFRVLTISGFIVVISMLVFGYLLSARSLRRLREIEAALSRTSQGDSTVRISDHGGMSQIDRIARQINQHLTRLSRMISMTRNTAAATAHDLKSPLGRAYLSVERARELAEEGESPAAALADTQVELENMRYIFDSYLQLSRIESAGVDHLATVVDLKELTCDMVETYAPIAEDAGQTVSFEAGEGMEYIVSGDGQMLQQMLANLLENAVTHGPADTVITVSLTRVLDGICLTVADTGPGIPEESKERVFEPFHRLDPSRSGKGSGLGLALVRAIAEKHGGSVALVDNQPGLRVVVSLPLPASPQEGESALR